MQFDEHFHVPSPLQIYKPCIENSTILIVTVSLLRKEYRLNGAGLYWRMHSELA